ncbi:hypothetical protein ANCDUO_25995 [Ancylostoma duodenale]|uniref:SCP domain-containing protein n=1 Tax=Ancylostoma duodenale TaxID=51022 RepID=A0A0C2FGB6_9BILA|nr:hypothetical protein ANCDUO_25995 [Ancylostoma duodenale]
MLPCSAAFFLLATFSIASAGVRRKRQGKLCSFFAASMRRIRAAPHPSLLAFGCSNAGISDAARLIFLNTHNEARLSVAQGLEPNKCGLLGPAKNMYKMVGFLQM